MPFPGVSVGVTNGNLLRSIDAPDGVGAIVATAAIAENIGKVQQVFSLQDAEKKGYTLADEPFLHGLIEVFYKEIGGNQKLWIMGVAETMTMTDVLDSTKAEGLNKLLMAAVGDITRVVVARKPSAGYNAGTKFLDTDVESAVLGSLPLCQAWQKKNQPVRVFIEGRVANQDVINDFKPNTANNSFVGVVLGGTEPDGSAAVSVALARACKYPVHVKIGSGQNGALSVGQIYIGSQAIEERLDMENLHDEGFITFHRRPGTAGYYFGVDNMCSADDYRILVHGGVIDKAQRITAAAYTPYIEDYVRINTDGTINDTDAKHLEDILAASIRSGMGTQISDVEVVIDPNQDIINTSTLQVQVKILPLGYLTWITVTLGLTTQLQAA
ncbi:MAG: DUF2586 family protein [Dysgonomonas sp.]|uniref:DUF2586 family protein n=1 Tax=Dysgonomonas sp. TaxID=1891233 RepID=UPI0039E27147